MGSAPVRIRPGAGGGGDRQTAQVGASPTLPPDLPGVSAPDVAFQFKPCVPADQEAALEAAVRTQFPTADIRPKCFEGNERVGVWMRPVAGVDDDAARNAALQSPDLDLLAPGENYAAFINATFIRSQAYDAPGGFADHAKDLNADFDPDPNGPIHLTGFHVDFEAPDRVITTVDGYDERPWPDVQFHHITTDVLTHSAGEVQIDHSDHRLVTDTSWLNVLTGSMGALTELVSGLFLLPTLIFLTEEIVIARKHAKDTGAGAGIAIYDFPHEVMIPQGLKAVMSYERVEVHEGGIFAGGTVFPVPRSPLLFINGGRRIAEREGTPVVHRTFSVSTTDLREPLRFAWTADGTVGSPGGASTSVTFRVQNPQPGQVLPKQVRVHVTDVDDLAADAAITIQWHVISDEVDPNDPDPLPPICRIKPWLPQCQPQT